MDVELIGRDHELAAIRAFLAAPAPAALLLEGEAGIGKTMLWRAGIAAADSSYGLLVARPASAESELSFAALGDLLADVLEEALSALPAPQRRGLEAALLLAEPDRRPADRRTIGAGLLTAVRALASRRPILVAIDDIQWLDSASRAALEFVVRRLREEPVRLLLAARTATTDEAPAEVAMAIGEERLRRLTIGPLSLGAVRSLLVTRLGVSLPRPVLGRLYETSGGNPFFALELAGALERHGGTIEPGAELPVPSEVGKLVDARIGELPSPTIAVLQAASALARPTVAGLAESTGADVQKALRPAVQAGVVHLRDDRVEFAHPLFASGVYAHLTHDEARLLHGRLAAVTRDVEERARHLALATEEPDADVADLLDEAAGHARARGAPSAAAELAELAVRLTPANASEDRTRRRILTSALHGMAGDLDRERAVLLELEAEVPAGPQRAEVLTRLAWRCDLATQADLFDQALAEAAGARVLEAWIGNMSGQNLRVLGELAHGRARQQRAFELLREIDGSLFVDVLGDRILLDTFAGEVVAEALLSRSLELARRPDVPPSLNSPLKVMGLRHLLAGRVDEARVLFDEYDAAARSFGDENLAGEFLVHRVQLECAAGRLETAAELTAKLEQYAAEVGRSGLALYPRALIAAYGGRIGEARAVGRAALAEAEAANNVWMQLATESVLGFAELSQPNLPEAWSILGPAAARAEAIGIRELEGPPLYANAAEAAVGVGELERARELVALLERHGRAVDSPAALHGATRGAAMVAAATSATNEAITLFERALKQGVAEALPLERGRTLLALGIIRRRAKQRRLARVTLQEAQRAFEELRATLWAEQARGELARIGGRTASPTDLTLSERRIAELVADGKTNKEVAAILVVADRTVESALTQIYRKLDVRSRTELARKLTSA